MKIKSPIKSYQIKNGETRYMFKLYHGTNPSTGKSQITIRRSFKRRKEAELAYFRLKLEVQNKTFKNHSHDTYKDIYDHWIVLYKDIVETSTFNKTTHIFKKYILPAMSHYRIEDIDYSTCQKHINEWANKLKHWKVVMFYASKVIDFAVSLRYTTKNPFKLVIVPPKKIRLIPKIIIRAKS